MNPDSLSRHADEATTRYTRIRPQYEQCAVKISDLLTAWLDEEQVNYQSVSARAKTLKSFREKAGRGMRPESSEPRYPNPLTDMTDLMGARVITFLPEAVERACEVVEREFDVVEHQDKGQLTKERGLFGYASRHYLVRLSAARAALPEYRVLKDKVFEIQVRTAAQHAWAEFEHDVRYKVTIPPELEPEFNRRFLLAAALVELADAEFAAIDERFRQLARETAERQRAAAQEAWPPFDVQTLINWLSERYPDAPKSKAEHYAWMLGILRHFDLGEPSALEAILSGIDGSSVSKAMAHRFPAGQVRRLDDELLSAIGQDYVTRQPADQERRALVLSRRLQNLRTCPGTPN